MRIIRWVIKRKRRRKRAKSGKANYIKYKEAARILAKRKVAQYNQRYGFLVNRIAIKNSKTRWGSCSKKGNRNFNYKIALLPEALADYIIVHELCHLGEFNHSKKFWALVARVIPHYKVIKKKFRHIRLV